MSDSKIVTPRDVTSIWALEEPERHVAVTTFVNECGARFREAVDQDDANAAQDFAIVALTSIAGLFPNNDDANLILQSILGMITDAKSGRTGHILMRSTAQIIGMRKGLGHAYIGGFAIAAVMILTDRKLRTVLGARKSVADILASLGYSLRKGEHETSIPITHGAIRNWSEHPDEFPAQHAISIQLAETFAANLAISSAQTLAEILAYLQVQATAAIQHSHALGSH